MILLFCADPRNVNGKAEGMAKLDVKVIRECTSRTIEKVWDEYKKQNEAAWIKYKVEVLNFYASANFGVSVIWRDNVFVVSIPDKPDAYVYIGDLESTYTDIISRINFACWRFNDGQG